MLSAPKPLTHSMAEIVDRMKAGEKLIGPVTVRRSRFNRVTRKWGWASGGSVHSATVAALAHLGTVAVHEHDDGREAVLAEGM